MISATMLGGPGKHNDTGGPGEAWNVSMRHVPIGSMGRIENENENKDQDEGKGWLESEPVEKEEGDMVLVVDTQVTPPSPPTNEGEGRPQQTAPQLPDDVLNKEQPSPPPTNEGQQPAVTAPEGQQGAQQAPAPAPKVDQKAGDVRTSMLIYNFGCGERLTVSIGEQ